MGSPGGTLGRLANGAFSVAARSTVAGSLPVLASVIVLRAVVPTGTVPKPTLAGVARNRPRAGSPMPVSCAVAVPPLLPVTARVPGSWPGRVGAKTTWITTDWPGWSTVPTAGRPVAE